MREATMTKIAKPLSDLEGKAIIVTGASRGIGRQIAEGLAACGAHLMLSGRTEETLRRAINELAEAYPDATIEGATADIKNCDASVDLVERTVSLFGRLDGLVCNAGGNQHLGPLSTVADEGFDKTVDVNVKSNVWLCQAATEALSAESGGSIVINSSAAAFSASDVLATYGVSKLAMLGVMRQFAMELGPKGINVNAICPSVVKTDFSKLMWSDDRVAAAMKARIPMGRIGEADDLIGITALLLSQSGRFINGQAISVCGGEFSWR